MKSPPRTAETARTDLKPTWIKRLAAAKGWMLFAREALANPRRIGAVVPSSPRLARQMARLVQPDGGSFVIELGAGTGVVTKALLARGVPAHRLVAVELAPSLAGLLRQRFPDIHVVCGDATDLRRIIGQAGLDLSSRRVDVVSSLPLRSLPSATVTAIVHEIGLLVSPRGSWIQFTYALRQRQVPPGFHRRQSVVVWGNVPPARVDVLTPEGQKDSPERST